MLVGASTRVPIGDLRLSVGNSTSIAPHMHAGTRLLEFGRALRSGTFFLAYACYLMVVLGLGQRLVIWPMCWVLPRRRASIVRAWLRLAARATLGMARRMAGVRVIVEGAIPPTSCIVVMNHQSVLDIPLGVHLIPGPYPLIPTRDRYKYGIPGISPLVRLARYPCVSQKRSADRVELRAITDAADQVARGEHSFLIFPEGHRTRDGNIGRFMRNGLRIVLGRADRPVYCIVVDGVTQSRTFAHAMRRFAGMTVRLKVLGPFTLTDRSAIEPFIDMLRDQMVAALAQIRGPSDEPADHVTDSVPAR